MPRPLLSFTLVSILAAATAVTGSPAQASQGWKAPQGVNIQLSAGTVAAMASGPNGDLFVAGNFTTDNSRNPERFSIGRWDGTRLTPVQGAPEGSAFSLTYDESTRTLFAGGYFTLAGRSVELVAWNGSAWTAVANFDFGMILALADNDQGTIYAGGSFRTINGQPNFTNVAAYSSGTWSRLGLGLNDAVQSFAQDSRGNVYAGGMFTASGSVGISGVAQWDGDSWSAVSATNNRATDVAMGPGNVLYASGVFTEAAGAPSRIVSMRLGTDVNWKPIAMPSGEQSSFATSLALTPTGDLVAGINGRVFTRKGNSWSALPGRFGGTITDIAYDRLGSVTAGGSFVSVDDIEVPGFAYRQLTPVPTAPTGVRAIASGRTINLTWDKPRPTQRVTQQRVRCTGAPKPLTKVVGASIVKTTVNAKSPGTYSCSVSAKNASGWGAWSRGVTVRVR
jgi:hypothetical protein